MEKYATFITKLLSKAGIAVNGSNPWDMQIKDPAVFKRIYKNLSLGAGESYMDGSWECGQLDEFFFRLLRYLRSERIYKKSTLIWFFIKHILFNQQSLMRARQVAEQHYDLDNALYEKMLGESMAYTCGYWRQANDIDAAQHAKYDLICKKLNLQAGEQVLELGCGFGGFSKFACERYGVHMTAVNISQEQMQFAKAAARDLPIAFHICDYRDVHIYNPKNIRFDKIVSIGMCEHVGHKNYYRFLKIARDNLKPDGLFLMHTIGKNKTASFADPWIQKYIFPNGMLPSLKQITKNAERLFVIEDVHNFGNDYDKTLMAWYHNFNQHWPTLQSKYSDRFYRMWNYYLLSCAGGFRARSMQLWQFVMSPHGQLNGYSSIR